MITEVDPARSSSVASGPDFDLALRPEVGITVKDERGVSDRGISVPESKPFGPTMAVGVVRP